MSTKYRSTLVLTQRQLALLRAEAERLEISLSELIRRIIDNHYQERGE